MQQGPLAFAPYAHSWSTYNKKRRWLVEIYAVLSLPPPGLDKQQIKDGCIH